MGRNPRGRFHQNGPQHGGLYTQVDGKWVPISNHRANHTNSRGSNAVAVQGGTNGRGRGRGGVNDRGRGFQSRGRGRGNFKPEATVNYIQQQDHNELVKFVVTGLLESDVANEKDNGLATCRDWLEERARYGSKKPIEYVYLKSPRWEGDNLVFEVRKSDAWRISKSDGQQFHNVALSVKRADQQSQDFQRSNDASNNNSKITSIDAIEQGEERIEKFKTVLVDRYDSGNKLLKLDRLGHDLRLRETGTWDPTATKRQKTDFFLGLMRLCESETIFPSRAIKAEQVVSISLANNELTNLAPVVELVKAFPDLRNLDLSNNKFKDIRALDLFRWKFKRLDWLVISPNPIDLEDPEYEQTLTNWFPSLRTLNTTRVRTDEAAASAVPTDSLPLATVKDNFQDEAGIAESAIGQLIRGTDHDRPGLARNLYDNESSFSQSYNASSPRLETTKSTSWEIYLKHSRNLKKVFQLEPRIRRLAKGVDEIQNAMKTLPPTRHPDLVNESLKYSSDCTPIPGVPDPQGRLEAGVGGFMVVVHGSFDEINVQTGASNATRSFDRVFILGPGKDEKQLRIVSDILILRAEGGYEAFNPQEKTMPLLPMVTKNFGFPVDTHMETEVRHAFVVEGVMEATGLTAEWATELSKFSGYIFQVALENFKAARAAGNLRNECYRPQLNAAALVR
ncbi:MAG: hypothetical protein Q9170_001368 [Blastenia crenularia]